MMTERAIEFWKRECRHATRTVVPAKARIHARGARACP